MNLAALLAAFYLTGGGAFMDSRPTPEPLHQYWRYDINVTKNPYGIAEIGFDVPYRQFSFTLAGRHISSIPVNDYGTNTVEFRVTWRPFAP